MLIWDDTLGVGYEAADPVDYGGAYWAEYRRRDATEIGRRLTADRLDLVRLYVADGEPVLDVGIGGGAFVAARPATLGLDVAPEALAWLDERGLRWRGESVAGATLWDSLEHVPVPLTLLARIRAPYLFVATPLVEPLTPRECVARYKHSKPGEHLWHWTAAGLERLLAGAGYDLYASDNAEVLAGREGIGRFTFRRRPRP